MAISYLFDTNTVIYFLSGTALNESVLDRLDKICEKSPHISIIAKLELIGYNFSNLEN
jgi:hypothetical protein